MYCLWAVIQSVGAALARAGLQVLKLARSRLVVARAYGDRMTSPTRRPDDRSIRPPIKSTPAPVTPEPDCVAAALARLLAYPSQVRAPTQVRAPGRAPDQDAPSGAAERVA